MNYYRFSLKQIAERIIINQTIKLKTGLKLVVKSKPYLSENGEYLFDCIKENILSTFSLNTIYERRLVLTDSLHLFNLPYKNHCWSCGATINSDYCEKCDHCGWYICNSCGACSAEEHQRKNNLCNK